MSDKSGAGFVADGAYRYLKGLNRQRAEIQQRLLSPELDADTRVHLERELAALERELAKIESNTKYSLF